MSHYPSDPSPPGVNPFLLPYTPGTYSTPGSAVGSSSGDLQTGSTVTRQGAAVTRKDQLAVALTKLRGEVDSLDKDGWMFEAPRHRRR